jgi:hypothetical protein
VSKVVWNMSVADWNDFYFEKVGNDLGIIRFDKSGGEEPKGFMMNKEYFKKMIEMVEKELPDWLE